MAKAALPRFIIYQQNEKDFHICFEVGNKFLRWCSHYAPTLDVRFPREVTRISDIAASKLPKKSVFDKGTYTVNKKDAPEQAAQKLAKGADEKSFAFILDGKQLQGRFSIKHSRGKTVIQKYKDKYAEEEDVLSGDLARTIQTMLPDYDPSKVKLPPKQKTKKAPEPVIEDEEPEEEITADKKIGNTNYHFTFYSSEEESDLCLVTNDKGEAMVLKLEKKEWKILSPISKTVLKKQKEFTDHAAALYEQED